jgi:hypothetical protein
MPKYEPVYVEGPKARKNFEAAMRLAFRAPKTEASNRPKRKPKKTDKG